MTYGSLFSGIGGANQENPPLAWGKGEEMFDEWL